MRRLSFRMVLAATAVLVAAAAYSEWDGARIAVSASRDERVFPGLGARLPNLAWMRLSRGDTKIDFTNVAGRWVLVEKGNYPASPSKIRRLLFGLAELAIVEPKTARTELFGRLDLDDPKNGKSTLVSLRDRTGKPVVDLIVGRVQRDALGSGADGVYIRRSGEEQAWLARGSFDLPGDILGWIDRRILDIPPASIASVTLRSGDGEVLVLRRDRPEDRFAIPHLPDGTSLMPDAKLDGLAMAATALDLDDVKPEAEVAFPQSGTATAEFATFDGLLVTLRLTDEAGATWIAVAASGSDGAAAEAAAINDRLARWVYAIPPARARLLRTRIGDLTEPAKGS